MRECPLDESVEPLPALPLPYDELVPGRLAYQIFDLMCPLAFTRMSTRARS
jgi:hypothetical protein